jgi:hypothetical protein
MKLQLPLLLRSVILASALSAHWTFAATVNLNPSADTWIFEESPDNNMGAATDFVAGFNAHGSAMRGLIKFDVSGIPANATITSVQLTLNVVKQHSAAPAATFDLHRVSESWNQGTGDGNTGIEANLGEATWTSRSHSVTIWTTPGGAFNSTVSSSVLVSSVGDHTFGSTANMVADVQSWVINANSNFGWLLKNRTESTLLTARRWASNEAFENKPTLVVSYTVPVQSPSISGVNKTNNQIRFSFNAEANRAYTVEGRGLLGAGGWSTVTNFPAPSVATNLVVSDTLTSSNRFYRVISP